MMRFKSGKFKKGNKAWNAGKKSVSSQAKGAAKTPQGQAQHASDAANVQVGLNIRNYNKN